MHQSGATPATTETPENLPYLSPKVRLRTTDGVIALMLVVATLLYFFAW